MWGGVWSVLARVGWCLGRFGWCCGRWLRRWVVTHLAGVLQVGNLDTPVDEEMVWELLTQAAPVQSVHLPRDRITNAHQARLHCSTMV